MTNKIVIGIDPGVKGGIAIFIDGEYETSFKMPSIENPIKASKVKHLLDTEDLALLLLRYKRNYSPYNCAYIEKAFAPAGQAGASYMQNYGMILGICVGLGIPYVEISPKDWQKSQLDIKDCFKTRKDGTPVRDKAVSVRKVNGLYPELKLKAKDDGIADAILIAKHGVETL